MAYQNSCLECEDAVHVYCVTKSGGEKVKLLEQTSCVQCWRPLLWTPKAHESLRPPFYTSLIPVQISVASCGHIFHTPCLSSNNHCPLCLSWIQPGR